MTANLQNNELSLRVDSLKEAFSQVKFDEAAFNQRCSEVLEKFDEAKKLNTEMRKETKEGEERLFKAKQEMLGALEKV